jgi:hypothetical protein
MKTRFIIDFHKSGITNNYSVALICNHNEGKSKLSLNEIYFLLKCERITNPKKLKKIKVILNEKYSTLEVYEDGVDLTYSIQENEYYLLKDTDSSDMDKQIAGEDALLLNPIFDRNNI